MKMSDLIDRQAAIDALNTLFKKQVTQFGYEGYEKADEKTQLVCDGISYSIGCVLNLPSAQPEIIRCKDCDWWTKQKDSLQGRCELMKMYPTGGWFCANGRRRTDG